MNENSDLLVSVIVPVYNVERFLNKCLDSICSQTYSNLEIIVVDDGSTDKSGTLCDDYAKKDHRIRVIHKQNGGLSSARNAGIKASNGDYLSFIDSDDWIESDMYSVMVSLAVKENADLVSCGTFADYTNSSVVTTCPPATFKNQEILKALISGRLNSNMSCNKMYRKEFFDGIEFPVGKRFEDVLTIYKTVRHMSIATVTDIPFYHYIQREDSINHEHHVQSLIDYWEAFYTRYQTLSAYDDYASDHDWHDLLLRDCVKAVSRVWRWLYRLPKHEKQAANDLSQTINEFVKQNYPLFGFSNMPLHFNACIFLAHFNNSISKAITYYSYLLIKKIKKSNI